MNYDSAGKPVCCITGERLSHKQLDGIAAAAYRKAREQRLPVVEQAFRELREAWFNRALRFDKHERDWESEHAEVQREKNNADMKAEYDRQTERLIQGDGGVDISPRCWANLDKHKRATEETK